jgi:hypothetical protein
MLPWGLLPELPWVLLPELLSLRELLLRRFLLPLLLQRHIRFRLR